MSLKLGPETVRGKSMNGAEYTALWQKLALEPPCTLRVLCTLLDIGVDHADQPNGRIIADVAFGRVCSTIESVHGVSMEIVLAKALALGIDRRLATIVQARVDLDTVTDHIESMPLVSQLERLILGATRPKTSEPPDFPEGSDHTTSAKGAHP